MAGAGPQGFRHNPTPRHGCGARHRLERGDRVQPRLELDDHLRGRAGPDAACTPDGSSILAHDGALQDLQAGGAQDVQTDLRSDPVDLDQHLEELELLDRSEAVEAELVFTHVRVNVQLDVAT